MFMRCNLLGWMQLGAVTVRGNFDVSWAADMLGSKCRTR